MAIEAVSAARVRIAVPAGASATIPPIQTARQIVGFGVAPPITYPVNRAGTIRVCRCAFIWAGRVQAIEAVGAATVRHSVDAGTTTAIPPVVGTANLVGFPVAEPVPYPVRVTRTVGVLRC